MPCPSRSTCAVLNDLCSDAERGDWLRAYCDADCELCERRRLSRTGVEVPDDLLPDGRLLVTMGELEELAL